MITDDSDYIFNIKKYSEIATFKQIYYALAESKFIYVLLAWGSSCGDQIKMKLKIKK